jgi:hypothetical protein
VFRLGLALACAWPVAEAKAGQTCALAKNIAPTFRSHQYAKELFVSTNGGHELQRSEAMACAAITYNCFAFFHCPKINNFTFCPKLFAAAWAMSRLLWFRGVAFLLRRWRKFALVAGLVCGAGCVSALALCGAVGECGLRLAVCSFGL